MIVGNARGNVADYWDTALAVWIAERQGRRLTCCAMQE